MLRPGKQPSNNGDYYPNQSGGSYYNNDAYAYNAGYNQNYQQHQQQQQQQSYNSGGGYYNGGAAPMYDSSYSQPQQQTLPSPRRSPAESPIMSLLKNKWIWTLLLCFLLFCLSIYHYKQHKTVLSKLKVSSAEQAERLFQDTERERLKWKKDSHVNMHAQEEYKSKIATLTAENEKLLLKLENSKLSAKRESAMKRQIELLQNATSRESKRAVLDKFGPGPHRVKLTLKVPNGKNTDVTLETVVVEMAPLHLVPHAIHLFLEQVSHKLWDGTYVYLNGPHIMQSGPQGHDNRHKITSGVQRFSDQQLDKLAFPEYSPEYPHLPYTLGYTGRPGGPDFYINKGDNTIPHGPGGQVQHGIEEQADSCFASVVEGRDVINKIYKLRTYPPSHQYAYFFVEPIEIASAQIISPETAQNSTPKIQQAAPKTTMPKPQNAEQADNKAKSAEAAKFG